MKAYFDTNVLVAASVQGHPQHVQAFDLIEKVKEGTFRGVISTHGSAEYYSVLTRAPFTSRIHPADAGRLLEENILPYFELVSLSTNDYKAVLLSGAKVGLAGGVIFDALHLHCAQKAECDRIYTFNLRDFRALAARDWVDKITAP